jgi:hypothetical protein
VFITSSRNALSSKSVHINLAPDKVPVVGDYELASCRSLLSRHLLLRALNESRNQFARDILHDLGGGGTECLILPLSGFSLNILILNYMGISRRSAVIKLPSYLDHSTKVIVFWGGSLNLLLYGFRYSVLERFTNFLGLLYSRGRSLTRHLPNEVIKLPLFYYSIISCHVMKLCRHLFWISCSLLHTPVSSQQKYISLLLFFFFFLVCLSFP